MGWGGGGRRRVICAKKVHKSQHVEAWREDDEGAVDNYHDTTLVFVLPASVYIFTRNVSFLKSFSVSPFQPDFRLIFCFYVILNLLL